MPERKWRSPFLNWNERNKNPKIAWDKYNQNPNIAFTLVARNERARQMWSVEHNESRYVKATFTRQKPEDQPFKVTISDRSNAGNDQTRVNEREDTEPVLQFLFNDGPRNPAKGFVLGSDAKQCAFRQNGKKRGEDRVKLLGSSDPEIRGWPSFRSKQIGRIVSKPSGVPSFREYLPAFNNAIREVFPTIADHNEQEGSIQVKRQTVTTGNLEKKLEDFAQDIRNVLGLNFSLDLPLGSLDNQLAIVYGIPEWKESSPSEKSHNGLPFHLEKAGLTATNSLVWAVDFGSSRQIQLDHSPESSHLYDYLSALTFWMLQKSAARVVLVSGDMAQRYITRRIDSGLSPPLRFELRGQQITFWLDVSEGKIQRVCIDVPDLFKVLSTYTWRLSHQMSFALKLASIIIGLKDLNHRYYENRGALGQIFDTVRTEKAG